MADPSRNNAYVTIGAILWLDGMGVYVMEKTGYKISKEGVIFTATMDGKIISRCFDHVENALHSIFITEGSKEGSYYVLDGEDVYLTRQKNG